MKEPTTEDAVIGIGCAIFAGIGVLLVCGGGLLLMAKLFWKLLWW